MRVGVFAVALLIGCTSAPAPEMSPAAQTARPRATFTPAYQAAHRGQIEPTVPDVYEMVTIAIALTANVAANPGRVPTQTDYYRSVAAHFEPMRRHPFVLELNRQLDAEPILTYIRLKLNAYAFAFDARSRIVRSDVYDRIDDEHTVNPLTPLMPLMQSFADQSGFRSFYAAHTALYDEQIEFFRTQTDAPDMWNWLRTQFPGVAPYDGVKIVLSPLAGNIQNEASFESNGYRELQLHLNFPYNINPDISPEGNRVWRGTLLFGEMNHGFINPHAERHRAGIDAAIGRRAIWTGPANAAAYPDDLAVFNEYLNFGVITLYHRDRMNAADGTVARRRIDTIMVENRGFLKFAEFDAFLRELYGRRSDGQTVADLYPQIIDWFAAQEREPAATPQASQPARGSAPSRQGMVVPGTCQLASACQSARRAPLM